MPLLQAVSATSVQDFTRSLTCILVSNEKNSVNPSSNWPVVTKNTHLKICSITRKEDQCKFHFQLLKWNFNSNGISIACNGILTIKWYFNNSGILTTIIIVF